MNPFRSIWDAVNIRIPRVSGDEPARDWGKSDRTGYSPRERG